MKSIQMIITELDHLVAELSGQKLRTLFVAHRDFCCLSLGTAIPRQIELAGKASFVASPPAQLRTESQSFTVWLISSKK